MSDDGGRGKRRSVFMDFAWDGKMDSDGPDGVSSVQLLPESVERCTCPRCMLAPPTGVLLSALRSGSVTVICYIRVDQESHVNPH